MIWYKSVPQENAKLKPWIEWLELREVDCSRRRYKRLQGKAFYENNPMEDLGETSWTYLEPSDLDVAFYNVSCRRTPQDLTDEELCEKLNLSYDKELKKCK